MYTYDADFYDYINSGARHAAQLLAPGLVERLPSAPRSVLDVGCGAGAWLAAWQQLGVDVCGVDGDYVDRERMLIDPALFIPHDLARPFDLGRQFDLVQCLEVAEHLPEEVAVSLVTCLCRHGDIVLFSAAPPGQGGENHVNERPYAYWRDLFAAQGFAMYDAVRPLLAADTEVKPWYRYNMFLYLRESALESTHQRLAATRVAREQTPPDLSPALYRLRKRLVALLPVRAMTGAAVLKKTLFNALGGRS